MPRLISPFILLILLTSLWQPGYGEKLEFFTTNYPPYEIAEPKDGLEGFDVEVVKEVLTRAEIDASIQFIPWKRAVTYVLKGKALAMFSCGYSEERERLIYRSDPISTLTPVIAVHAAYNGPELNHFSKLSDLFGVGIRGYTYEKELADLGIKHTVLNDDETALQFITLKRADFFYTGKENLEYLARQMGLSDHIKYYELTDRDTTLFYVCFSKKWPYAEKYLHKFNQALAEIKKDGTFKAIYKKYR